MGVSQLLYEEMKYLCFILQLLLASCFSGLLLPFIFMLQLEARKLIIELPTKDNT